MVLREQLTVKGTVYDRSDQHLTNTVAGIITPGDNNEKISISERKISIYCNVLWTIKYLNLNLNLRIG